MKIKTFLLIVFLNYCFSLFAQVPPTSGLGYLDTTFNKTGAIKGEFSSYIGGGAKAIAVDERGRIVIASCSTSNSYDIRVVRLKANGTIDKPFGLSAADSTANIVLSPYVGANGSCTSVAIQKDGKILVGGTTYSGTGNSAAIVLRLNTNGTMDSTFDSDGLLLMDLSIGNDQVNDIAVQSNGKIILSGTSASKIVVMRLNMDGSKDTGFNSYVSNNTSAETAAGLEIVHDTIVVGGSYYTSPDFFYSVLKLAPNGTVLFRKDVNFSATSASAGDIAIQSDGKIIIGGSDYSGFRAYRLYPDGNFDNSFATSGTFLQTLGFGAGLRSILVEKNGKIALIGSYNGNYVIFRTDTSGTMDNNFGSGGKLVVNTGQYTSFAKSTLSPDQKLLVAGDISSMAVEAIKVELKPVIHILGNTYASPKSIDNYKVEVPPSMTGLTYSWAYSGKYAYFFPDATSATVSVVYSDTATAGKLTCTVSNTSGVLGIGEAEITINKDPSNASELSKLNCDTKLTDCSGGYIDYFSLNTLINQGSGCSANGYSDYTKSNYTDTLSTGGVYAANLYIPGNGTNYVGIWIDYNNDGNFSNIDEFVGEGYSRDSKVTVDIFLKNREGYEGAKRLRVRSRPDVKFSSSESCQSAGETGETEDYLIVLSNQPALEAPQIITPNDDGKNDYFVIRGVKPDLKNKLIIFDRWGQVRFSADNYENTWDGTSKGEKLIPGTYYYLFTNDDKSIRGFLEIRY